MKPYPLLCFIVLVNFTYPVASLESWSKPDLIGKKKIIINDFGAYRNHSIIFRRNDSSAIPGLRAHHALVYDEQNQCIILSAGSTPLDGGKSFEVYNDLWDFKGKKWISKEASGDKRSSIRLAYDSKRNNVYSFGGYSPDSSFCDLRVLEKGHWKIVSTLPPMRAAEHGFVYDIHRDKLIVFGGSSSRGQVNKDTWEWNGRSWKKFNGINPPGRQAFAMIYDAKRKKTILYGGFGVTPNDRFADTWEYNGVTWTLINANGPGLLHGMGFTYDSKRGQFLLFGGIDHNGRSGTTWAFNGTTWNKLSAQGPPGRAMGYMAYDKIRDRVVMFGGRLTWPNDLNDTWEWDGDSWKEIKN